MLTYPPVKKVSVVIPVYNEQDSLPELLRRTDAACATLGRQYEILLIDDGSSDDSARMLTEAAEAEGSHVVAVLLNRNYGQHSAIMAGFSHVTGDLIITLDADLQNPPEEIPRLVAKADEGYDVVGTVLTDSAVMYGSRIEELNEKHGAYSEEEARLDHNLHMLGLKTDSMMELTYEDRKRIHNLKYYTWVEQQARDVKDLNALWYDTKGTWDAVHAQAKELDELINEFNEATGLLKAL